MNSSLTWYAALDAILDSDVPPAERLLMVALVVRAGLQADGVAYPCVATLARQTGVSARHVRRMLRSLESRELIAGERRDGRTTRYRIVWQQLVPDPGHGCPPCTDHPGLESPRHPDADVRPARTSMSAHPGHPCPPNLPLNVSQQPSPSTARGWGEIEKELRDEGIHEWREAVKLASGNGCRPTDIQAVIDYFREHRDAWESPAGALYRRVANATPDQPADELATWLPMKPGFIRWQKECQQRTADEKRRRLAEVPREQARALLIWGIDREMVSPEMLDTFDSDPQFQLWIDKQNLLASLMAARDAATKPPDAIAQPPPHNRAQKRTQHSSHAASGSAETAPALPNRDHSTRIMP